MNMERGELQEGVKNLVAPIVARSVLDRPWAPSARWNGLHFLLNRGNPDSSEVAGDKWARDG
ncbi:MAG: hypothetical protein EBZ36_17570 [Acidobacteria bacterium]|nr:hypothetical protein [Acidobacteriota bacterium]